MKKIQYSLLTAALSLALISGCGKAPAAQETADQLSKPEEVTETTQSSSDSKDEPVAGSSTAVDTAEPETQSSEAAKPAATVDLKSEDALLSYLAGEWNFIDIKSGEAFAKSVISYDGGITYDRVDGSISAKGLLSFSMDRENAPSLTSYSLNFRSIDVSDPNAFGIWVVPKEDTSSGDFHIGHADDLDYLWLSEVGNGDTFTSNIMFNNTTDPSDEEYYLGDLSCVMVRENTAYAPGTPAPANSEFYGFVWKRDADGSLWIENMTPVEYETYEEYTCRHVMAGYFLESNEIGMIHCNAADSIDTSGLFMDNRWTETSPLRVYSLKTDGNGDICAVTEIPSFYYGLYEMAELEPEFSYDGTEFLYNIGLYDLKELDTPANAIMDATKVGNWIVVEGHINPRTASYHLFNIDFGQFERTIYGTNLTWHDDDLSTAVYADDNTIYNFKGHPIATLPGDKINSVDEIRFIDDTHIEVDYTVGNGVKELSNTEKIEIPENRDKAMYLFADYARRPTKEKWEKFMALAPEKACLFVIVNPPEEMSFLAAGVTDVGALDNVVACSLADHTFVILNKGDVTFTDDGSYLFETTDYGEYLEYSRGGYGVYNVTVPEGIPSQCMLVKTDDGSGQWLVSQISGESDQQSLFILEDNIY